MAGVNIPPPNPNKPEGMAFLCSAGGVDPRPGKSLKTDRIPLLLTQAWAAQSELFWKLGIRWHPELATHHLKGGGQFQLAEILDGPPPEPEPEMSDEQIAEKILDMVAETKPEFVKAIRKLRASGTEEEKAAALKKLDLERSGMESLMDYLKDQ